MPKEIEANLAAISSTVWPSQGRDSILVEQEVGPSLGESE